MWEWYEKEMKDNRTDFSAQLGKIRRRWLSGLTVAALFRAAGYLLAAASIAGLLDFFLAFEPGICIAIDAAILIGVGLLVLVWLVGIWQLDSADAARRIDGILKSRRCVVLSGLELDNWLTKAKADKPSSEPELQIYLVERAIEGAGEELKRLGFADHFPFRELWMRIRRFAGVAAAAAALMLLNTDAAKVIATRFVAPLRDTPPYSRYTFDVSPDKPTVVYGGNAEVSVRIGGAPVRSQVWFLTRHRGKVHRAACFQDSEGSYAQRMEKLVAPVDFCFATGRARSKWRPVELLLQPEIASVDVTIRPPAYTGKPKRQFKAGREELAGYKGSRVEMFVRSNRPLAESQLTIKSRRGLGSDKVVRGEKAGPNIMLFGWNLQDDAKLEVVVRDVRGAKNREPLVLEQKVIPDRPPEASISEPQLFSMATPDATITVAGRAEDDLGLRKAELARTVVGYRDRYVRLDTEPAGGRLNFSRKIDFKAIGARAGEVHEFFVEASDTNPELTGVAASEIVRVQIISEKEYAELVRARTTLEEFGERYKTIRSNLNDYTKALESLQNVKDKSQIEAALKAAKAAAKKATDELSKIAMDFPIFDIEEELKDLLGETTAVMRRQVQDLELIQAPYDGLAEKVKQMIEDFRAAREQVDINVAEAEEVEAVGKIMQIAATWRELVEQQADLVRRLDRFSKDSADKDVKMLGSMGKRQSEIREKVIKFVVEELRKRAKYLPQDFTELRDNAKKFADLVERFEIPGLMKKAVIASENQDGKNTHGNARLALEKMKELMENEKDGAFGGMAQNRMGSGRGQGQGQGQGQGMGRASLKETLSQLLSALLSRGRGQGQGQSGMGLAGGGSQGGDEGDGYWSGGYSVLDVPISGPARMSFQSPTKSGREGGSGVGAGAGSPSTTAAKEVIGTRGDTTVESESLQIENLPEKYRNAIKKYFSTMEEKRE